MKVNNKMELRVNLESELVDTKIETLFEKTVTKFGSGAKIDCPKEYLGKKVYVVVRKAK